VVKNVSGKLKYADEIFGDKETVLGKTIKI